MKHNWLRQKQEEPGSLLKISYWKQSRKDYLGNISVAQKIERVVKNLFYINIDKQDLKRYIVKTEVTAMDVRRDFKD